ncbi:hypothetical protein ACFP1L_13880 [Lactiplantibacillus nangangensis]|uniref:Extracellular protein n=1 Tax=Lactiplantibacillus nangangensis TaxID=2559917 RepID=A0ABW1SNP6_9LACO|nr:hypothetical protein [Lactiplantibacillus nangangensis]
MDLKKSVIVLMTGLSLSGVLLPAMSASASVSTTATTASANKGFGEDIALWDSQQIADFFNQKRDVNVELTYSNWNHIGQSQIKQVHDQGIAFGKSNLPYSDERAGTTKVVKAAIKFILKNKKAVLKEVEAIGGKKAKAALSKAYGAVTPKLNKLLKYESLAWGNVQSAFTSALIQVGVKASFARSVSYWVVKAAQWLV